jgi:hypothetical protein
LRILHGDGECALDPLILHIDLEMGSAGSSAVSPDGVPHGYVMSPFFQHPYRPFVGVFI